MSRSNVEELGIQYVTPYFRNFNYTLLLYESASGAEGAGECYQMIVTQSLWYTGLRKSQTLSYPAVLTSGASGGAAWLQASPLLEARICDAPNCTQCESALSAGTQDHRVYVLTATYTQLAVVTTSPARHNTAATALTKQSHYT